MKRKWLLLILCLCLTLAGCGKKDGGTDSGSASASSAVSASSENTDTDSKTEDEIASSAASVTEDLPIVDDAEIADCITLGDYKGLVLEKKITQVTDADIDEYIRSALMVAVEDENETVREGDLVDIAYKGTLDGVAFDGGTSDSYNLEIGSHTFIDGFEEGIIGMKREETRDLNLTFPENYGNTDLAGKDVVFTVTVNMISRPTELTDEWVAANTDYSTTDEYRQNVRAELEASNSMSAESDLETLAMQTAMANAEMKQLPREYVTMGEDMFDRQWEMYASAAGQDLDTYVETNIGREQYDQAKNQYGVEVAKIFLFIRAVQEAEGWSTEDADYQERLNTYVDSSGLTQEEFLEQNDANNIELSIMMERLTDLILDQATVNEVVVDANGTPVE